MAKNALVAQGVDFSYYNGLVLKDVGIALERGELVGLLGPNGSGKTTLLNVLSGLLSPKRGQVLLGVLDIGSNSAQLQVVEVRPGAPPLPTSRTQPRDRRRHGPAPLVSGPRAPSAHANAVAPGQALASEEV